MTTQSATSTQRSPRSPRPRSARTDGPEHVRITGGGSVICAAIEVKRLDFDDAGEPRVLEGSAVIVGRNPALPL